MMLASAFSLPAPIGGEDCFLPLSPADSGQPGGAGQQEALLSPAASPQRNASAVPGFLSLLHTRPQMHVVGAAGPGLGMTQQEDSASSAQAPAEHLRPCEAAAQNARVCDMSRPSFPIAWAHRGPGQGPLSRAPTPLSLVVRQGYPHAHTA